MDKQDLQDGESAQVRELGMRNEEWGWGKGMGEWWNWIEFLRF